MILIYIGYLYWFYIETLQPGLSLVMRQESTSSPLGGCVMVIRVVVAVVVVVVVMMITDFRGGSS